MFRWPTVITEWSYDLRLNCPLTGNKNIGQSLCFRLAEQVCILFAHVLKSTADRVSFAIRPNAELKTFMCNTAAVDGQQSCSESIDHLFQCTIHGHRRAKNQL